MTISTRPLRASMIEPLRIWDGFVSGTNFFEPGSWISTTPLTRNTLSVWPATGSGSVEGGGGGGGGPADRRRRWRGVVSGEADRAVLEPVDRDVPRRVDCKRDRVADRARARDDGLSGIEGRPPIRQAGDLDAPVADGSERPSRLDV